MAFIACEFAKMNNFTSSKWQNAFTQWIQMEKFGTENYFIAKSTNSNSNVQRKSATREMKNSAEQQQNCRIICGNSTKLLNTISEIFEMHFCSNLCYFICTSIETIRKWMTVGCRTSNHIACRLAFKRTHSNKKHAWIMAGNEKNTVLLWMKYQWNAQNQHTAHSWCGTK